jgi:uncharacterized protein
MPTHETHPTVIKRVRRGCCHLSSFVKMLEEGKSCLEAVQQLQPVEKPITKYL